MKIKTLLWLLIIGLTAALSFLGGTWRGYTTGVNNCANNIITEPIWYCDTTYINNRDFEYTNIILKSPDYTETYEVVVTRNRKDHKLWSRIATSNYKK